MSFRICVRSVIVNDKNELFCVLHKPYLDEQVPDYWCTPGGGIDDKESFSNALTREVTEELGVTPVIGDLLYVQQFFSKSRQQDQIELFFHVTNWQDFTNIDLSKTSHGVEEIADYGFIDPSKTKTLPLFLKDVELSNIKPTGNPAQIFAY